MTRKRKVTEVVQWPSHKDEIDIWQLSRDILPLRHGYDGEPPTWREMDEFIQHMRFVKGTNSCVEWRVPLDELIKIVVPGTQETITFTNQEFPLWTWNNSTWSPQRLVYEWAIGPLATDDVICQTCAAAGFSCLNYKHLYVEKYDKKKHAIVQSL